MYVVYSFCIFYMPKHACRVFPLRQVLTVSPTLALDLWPTCLCPQQTDWGLSMSQAVIFMGFITSIKHVPGPSGLFILVPALEVTTECTLILYPVFSVILFQIIFFFLLFALILREFLKNYIPYLISSFQFYQVCFKSSWCFHSLFPDFVLLLPCVFTLAASISQLLPLTSQSPVTKVTCFVRSWGCQQQLVFRCP